VTENFRQTTASDGFPYTAKTVPFIMIKGGKAIWAKDASSKLAMLRERGGKILAVWPGQYSTDVFEIDDRRVALAALGDEGAMKALSGCKHTFKVHDQSQSTSQTRHMSVELTCGCQPEFGDDAAMNDLLRQLRTTLGWQVRTCTGGSYGVGSPRIYGIDIAAGANKVVRTS
jgi:hypothetical protein